MNRGVDQNKPGEPLLVVQDLVKNFGGLRAIDHCTLEVRRGTITGLIGPNGAGKTTLFNIITGFIAPDSGRVLFKGQDITNLPAHRIFDSKLCRTFQIPREHPSMTVLENLMLVAPRQTGERIWNTWFRAGRVREEESRVRERALEVLDFIDLGHLADEYAGKLSGGQKKLLELGRTLMAEPKLLLLDEPSAGLAPKVVDQIFDSILRINEEGLAILMVEQNARQSLRMAHRGYVLANGENRVDGTGEALLRDPDVARLYLGG